MDTTDRTPTGWTSTPAAAVCVEETTAIERPIVSNEHKHYAAAPVVRELWGRLDAPDAGPQAFLVERFPARSRFGAHFHAVDQFQVFAGGPGAWYQRHDVPRPVLHYADAYTTYGPFGTRSEPMSFFTFRPTCSTLTAFMPGSRDQLVRKGRRNIHVELADHLEAALLGTGTSTRVVIPPHDDGLAAHLITVAPGDTAPLPRVEGTAGGRSYCIWSRVAPDVVTGFRPSHVAWEEPGSDEVVVRAGEDAPALVLSLQFPTPVEA